MHTLESIAAYAGEMGCATQILPPAENGIVTLVITPSIVGRGDDMTGDIHVMVAQHPKAIRWMVSEDYSGSILDPAPNEDGAWARMAEHLPNDLTTWAFKLWADVTQWRGVAYTVDPQEQLADVWVHMRTKFDAAVYRFCEEMYQGDAELQAMKEGQADG